MLTARIANSPRDVPGIRCNARPGKKFWLITETTSRKIIESAFTIVQYSSKFAPIGYRLGVWRDGVRKNSNRTTKFKRVNGLKNGYYHFANFQSRPSAVGVLDWF